MKKKLLSLVITGVCMGAIPSAFAADDAAILKRLDQLEAKRKADQVEIEALRAQVQKLEQKAAPAAAGISSDEAAKLREEIVAVDKKASSRVDSVKRSIDTEREKLKINGYMSVYGTKSTNSAVTLSSSMDNHVGFKSDTVAGIQFDYQVNPNIDAVIQLQSAANAGTEEYDVEATWAFLRYSLSPSTKIRAGRMATPNFMYAESIDVGYTYPWVRPPVEMYGVAPIRYQGIDLTQNFNTGPWNNSIQFFYGDADAANKGTTSDYMAGAALTLNNDAWTVRASYSHVDNVAVSAAPSATGASNYLSGAVRYDDGGLFAMVEGKQVKTTGDFSKFIVPTVEGFYTTLGYQLDAFFPYATWAKAYTSQDGNVANPNSKQSQESLGLGLRYNLTDKVVLKGEATKYDHFNGTQGVSSFVPAALATPAVRQSLDDDGVTLMSLGFDAIF